ncbi:hypothetical protein NEMBOFW57_005176 [Staphylotrichum longicolle]|uniref:Uncharacterized protein n=1 Tax=Staphylotrichum longicolle TaxID=669026 RepID=A0AAD4EZV2_9PEZI|nr:hypothetical protein NEMBOFW57_005176 [Staphylotrichum longicolle]
MDQTTPQPAVGPDAHPAASNRPPAPARKRSSSGAGGLLSKLPFMRSTGEYRPRSRRNTNEAEPNTPMPSLPIPSFITIPAEPPQRHVPAAAAAPPPLPHILQHQTSEPPQLQQKTRRRRGSLRKVALLGRGAQRERREGREGRGLSIDIKYDQIGRNGASVETRVGGNETITSSPVPIDGRTRIIPILRNNGDDLSSYGLGISDLTPRPSMDSDAVSSGTSASPTAALAPTVASPTAEPGKTAADTSPSINYSTTDDEDALHMARPNAISIPAPRPSATSAPPSTSLLRPERASLSSGSDSYFLSRPPGVPSTANSLPSLQRRRSATIQRAKSPLALTSLATPLPAPDADWTTPRRSGWGWIILLVTWTVFVTGMGSCLGVWSWAWDGDDAIRAARAGRRSHAADCGLLPGADDPDGGHGLGLGGGGMGGNEVFPACTG